MGVNERTVQRRAHEGKIPGRILGNKRHLFNKKIINKWISNDQPIYKILKTPTSPIQEKAWAMFNKGDHSWMSEEEYEGNSYLRETQVDPHSKYKMMIGFIHTCYFCGYTEYHYC